MLLIGLKSKISVDCSYVDARCLTENESKIHTDFDIGIQVIAPNASLSASLQECLPKDKMLVDASQLLSKFVLDYKQMSE